MGSGGSYGGDYHSAPPARHHPTDRHRIAGVDMAAAAIQER